MDTLASITIGMSPNIFDTGSLVLSWHGLLTFVAVAVSVYLVARWGAREGLVADSIYSVSVWAIIGGIVGARLVHVIDFWDEIYQHDPISLLYVWEGGIAIYGAITGGFIAGALYIIIRNSSWFLALWARFFRFAGTPTRAPLPTIGHLADITAPALLISMAIGRVGDIINGEHFAKATELPWGIIYTHQDSPGLGRPASHPAVAYELLFDLALLGIVWPLRHRLRPHGMLFVLYGALYSVGRFFLSFLRDEFNQYFLGLDEAQLIGLAVMLITIPLLVYKAQLVRAAPQKTVRRREAR
jgi:phosphatidylglycerol:prolipoprotein diacylglycerol transferase